MRSTSSRDRGGSPARGLRRPRRSLLTAALAGLLAATLAVGLVATPIAAHAYLSETDPENGEQLESPPDEVTLQFSGDGVVNADVSIEDPNGEDVSGDPEIDPDDTQVVRVPIDESAAETDGMYTVDWEVLAEDGHTTAGSFFFAVGDEPLDRDAVLEAHEPDETDESIPPLEAGAKALLLVGVAGLIGIPATAAFAAGPVVSRGDSRRRAMVDRRVTRLLAGVTALALVGAGVLGLVRSTALGPISTETIVQFAETPLGVAWIAQIAIATGIGLAVIAATRRRDRNGRRVSLFAPFAGGIALAGTIAWTSHSATAIDRLQGSVVDFAHVVGAGLWVGGLAVLALVVVPVVRDDGTDPEDRPALLERTIRRFSVLALAGVTLVVATGFALASWHVPTADGLTETFYGLTLVAKLVLATGALALAGVTRFVLLSRLESSRAAGSTDAASAARTDGGRDAERPRTISRIRRVVRVELGLLVVVLLLSGVLTSAPTAAVAGGDGGPEAATIEYEYDEHVVEVTALPVAHDAAGESLVLAADEPIVFEVAFLEAEGGEPVESEQPVRLLASGEDGTAFEVELEETDDGSYATVQPLAADGHWELRITGAPGGSYVSEWIDATVLPADDHADLDMDDHADHDHGDAESEHDHGDVESEHDHGDVESAHDHGDADHTGSTSPFQALLQFGAVATVIVGGLAVTIESVRLRDEGAD